MFQTSNKVQGLAVQSILKNMVALHTLNSELRDQVIAPPTYSLFWLRTLFFVCTKAFYFESLMLTLEFWCILVVGGVILILRTLPNCKRINKELQSLSIFYIKLFYVRVNLIKLIMFRYNIIYLCSLGALFQCWDKHNNKFVQLLQYFVFNLFTIIWVTGQQV